MPIQESNIVFLESQIMDDVPEGGGAATGNVIIDGQMNNVFPDISDLDRAYGRFNLRKLFLAVRSLDTDLYGGAKTVITALPSDPAVGYTLFTTEDAFDTRTDSATSVENYLYKGPLWHGWLHENHIAGMRAISVIQNEDTDLPPIGKTFCLVTDEDGTTERQQYIRVIDSEAVLTEFEDEKGKYYRWIVRMELSDALEYNFDGFTVNRYNDYPYGTDKARLRDTTVADATLYFGTKKLTQSASIGDREIRAESMFTQLVPSARTETPLISQILNPHIVRTYDAGARDVEVAQQAHTLSQDVTVENRTFNWIKTLGPNPAPATLSISYMAQGNWYILYEDGNGIISGSDPTYGSGTLNYATGTVNITTGALPDADSQIIYVWGSAIHFNKRATHADIDHTIRFVHDLGTPVKPATLVLTWLVGGVTKTASALANGFITGDAEGFVSCPIGRFSIEFPAPPDPMTSLGVEYQEYSQTELIVNGVSPAGGIATISVGEPVEIGTLTCEWELTSRKRKDSVLFGWRWVQAGTNSRGSPSYKEERFVRSTNSTSVNRRYVIEAITDLDGNVHVPGVENPGVINYVTGDFTLPILPTIMENSYTKTGYWSGSTSESDNPSFDTGQVIVRYTPAGANTGVIQTTVPLPGLTFNVLPYLYDEFVIPESVQIEWNGVTYIDRSGVLYRDVDPVTGAGTLAGTINYTDGTVNITNYDSGNTQPLVTSLLTTYGDFITNDAVFRTVLAPIAPDSLSIVATTEDGVQIIGQSTPEGNIVGDNITGNINYLFGTASLEFTDGTDPVNVIPSTIRYNAVAYKYLPLDPSILGINAVRLPPDGRVPIYRPGGIAMVMHTDDTSPVTISSGQSISAGRTRLAWVRVLDANGETVSGDLYTLDRDNGTITIPDVTGLIQPLTLRHTVADLRMISDAQISGALTLSRSLTHDYPANESLVASCLIQGDRRARVSHTFDQTTWDNTWKDYQVGSAATANLNTIDYPITVNNEGTDTDRWCLKFTSATAGQVISEKRGVLGNFDTSTELAIINPRTRNQDGTGGTYYFRVPQQAWGIGWATGNTIRINTVGAIADFWIARSIQQSDEPLGDGADGCEVYALGNIDRP
jgi:hypothetical protein